MILFSVVSAVNNVEYILKIMETEVLTLNIENALDNKKKITVIYIKTVWFTWNSELTYCMLYQLDD